MTECLVYNVPNQGFQIFSYKANVEHVLAHLFNGMLNDGGSDEWVEVNGLKWLFHPTQRWTKAQARTFLSRAWDFLGFE